MCVANVIVGNAMRQKCRRAEKFQAISPTPHFLVPLGYCYSLQTKDMFLFNRSAQCRTFEVGINFKRKKSLLSSIECRNTLAVTKMCSNNFKFCSELLLHLHTKGPVLKMYYCTVYFSKLSKRGPFLY